MPPAPKMILFLVCFPTSNGSKPQNFRACGALKTMGFSYVYYKNLEIFAPARAVQASNMILPCKMGPQGIFLKIEPVATDFTLKMLRKLFFFNVTSNHVFFNAPGHIKNGPREPCEKSVQDRMLSGGGPQNFASP